MSATQSITASLSKCKVVGDTLFLPSISEGALENYSEVKKALQNAGAKYKRNTFVFPSDAQPYVDRLCGGEVINLKKEFQFFATPPDLADWLVELAEIETTDEVLEPSAGQGAIVSAIHRAGLMGITVWGYELMPENQTVVEKILGFRLLGSDFLECDTSFDKIVANPPFSKNQDIDHIRKMYECLRPGGRIVTVASNHWRQRESTQKKESSFRNWIAEVGAEVHDLEKGRFKESGTMVSSCVLVIDKV